MSKQTINDSDLCRAAKRAATSPAEIQTFLEVETKGHGFDEQDRPIILFERHWFHKLTGGAYDASHPNISNARAGGYSNGGSQYERFNEAFGLDPEAAMKSASWGIGQVMGFNYRICGYPTIGAFVDAMKESEGKQLDASIEFILTNNLDRPLRLHQWAVFAEGYNGADYKENDYDTKLARSFAKFSKRPIDCNSASQASPITPATDKPASEPSVNSSTGTPTNSVVKDSLTTQGAEFTEGTKPDITTGNQSADTILNKVSAAGDKWTAITTVLGKFGLSDPNAATSKGTILLTIFKSIGSVAFGIAAVLYNNWEYLVMAGLLITLAVLLWDRSKGRVADAKAGIPVEVLEEKK